MIINIILNFTAKCWIKTIKYAISIFIIEQVLFCIFDGLCQGGKDLRASLHIVFSTLL